MPVSARQVRTLYHALLRESKRFTDYNVRCYALRRIRDDFRSNKDVADAAEIQRLFNCGKSQLELVRRQVLLGTLYRSPENVIEAASHGAT